VLKLRKKGMSYNESLAMALVVFFNSHWKIISKTFGGLTKK
jgi:hypothetical protein